MNNELFIIAANLKQFYGRTVTKDMTFDETTENGKVHQTLKDLVLTTEVTDEQVTNNIVSKEESKLTQELPEGTVLIWDELQGYIIPHIKMYKLRDLEEEIKQVKEIYKDNTDINPKEE